MAPPAEAAKGFKNLIRKALPLATGITGAAGGGYVGYQLGNNYTKRLDAVANQIENKQIAEEFYNMGINTKTAEVMNDVYESAFVDELQKIAGVELDKEAAGKIIPFAKKMIESSKGGIVKGYKATIGAGKETGKQFRNVYKNITGTKKRESHFTPEQLREALINPSILDAGGLGAYKTTKLDYILNSLKKNPIVPSVIGGAGLLGAGGTAYGLTRHKKD